MSTDPQLRAAILNGQPGDVIAISGTVVLNQPVIQIRVPQLTLTCAAPGDGITAAAVAPSKFFDVFESDVTITGLVIDGSRLSLYPINVSISTLGTSGDRLSVVNNHVRCGSACLFSTGANSLVITDNSFESSNPTATTGVHLQRHASFPGSNTNNTRIERNVMVATTALGTPVFAAIRVRDGVGIMIRDNQISGPWSNGIAVTEMSESWIENNSVAGVRQFGLYYGATPLVPGTSAVTNLLARDNTLHGATNAVFVENACSNLFLANRLSVGTGGVEAFFAATTGANVMLGKPVSHVNLGAKDCDGDGDPDPNFLTGPGKKGSSPGPTISAVIHMDGVIVE